MEAETSKKPRSYELWVAIAISLFAALAFYFSTNPTLHDLDYTAEIASAFLRGDLGLREKPPEWLNEMIPYGDKYYSAFPLGAVISMLPVALLQKASLIQDFPARILAALIAGACVYFFFQLAKAFGPDYSSLKPKRLTRRILLALFPVFGTWTWCNLGMGGAWQIALGLALLGETAALYFTLVRPSPFIAGAFFTLAFGNRTELLITAPFFLYFFWRRLAPVAAGGSAAGARKRERLPYNVWIVNVRFRCFGGSSAPLEKPYPSAWREPGNGFRFFSPASDIGTADWRL